MVDEESRRWESSLSVCPGVGNRLPSEKKIANPGGRPGEGEDGNR